MSIIHEKERARIKPTQPFLLQKSTIYRTIRLKNRAVMKRYTIFETEEHLEWLDNETLKSKKQIQSRMLKIEDEGYFGNHKYLESEDLWELKFNDGRRIYYVIIPEKQVIFLLGGNKNGQSKDIRKASNILRKLIKG